MKKLLKYFYKVLVSTIAETEEVVPIVFVNVYLSTSARLVNINIAVVLVGSKITEGLVTMNQGLVNAKTHMAGSIANMHVHMGVQMALFVFPLINVHVTTVLYHLCTAMNKALWLGMNVSVFLGFVGNSVRILVRIAAAMVSIQALVANVILGTMVLPVKKCVQIDVRVMELVHKDYVSVIWAGKEKTVQKILLA